MLLVRQLGVRWSLDDFGTGYASLAAALDLPVDQIKLDRSLIHDLARGERTEVLVALASLVRACGHECLAEGVETTPRRRAAVRARIRVHALQGYLLARPMPAIDLDAILTRPTPLRL